MNFETIIWGTASSAVPSMIVYLSITFIFSEFRSLILDTRR